MNIDEELEKKLAILEKYTNESIENIRKRYSDCYLNKINDKKSLLGMTEEELKDEILQAPNKRNKKEEIFNLVNSLFLDSIGFNLDDIKNLPATLENFEKLREMAEKMYSFFFIKECYYLSQGKYTSPADTIIMLTLYTKSVFERRLEKEAIKKKRNRIKIKSEEKRHGKSRETREIIIEEWKTLNLKRKKEGKRKISKNEYARNSNNRRGYTERTVRGWLKGA